MLHNFGLFAAHYAPTMSTAWLHQTARDAALIMVPGISHLEALGNGGDLHMDAPRPGRRRMGLRVLPGAACGWGPAARFVNG